MEYVPLASYSLEILSPEVKLHKIHGSVSKVWRCGHVSSFLQCPCHSAPDIKYTNGGQVPSPLPCVLAEKSYQDSSGYARKEPTFNCVKQKKKKKKYIYWLMWLESPKVNFALVMAGTQSLMAGTHTLSLSPFLSFSSFWISFILRPLSMCFTCWERWALVVPNLHSWAFDP